MPMPKPNKVKPNGTELELAGILESVFDGAFTRVMRPGPYVGGTCASRLLAINQAPVRADLRDLQPPYFMPKLVIECKSYADYPWHQLIRDGNSPQIDSWIDQAHVGASDGDFVLVALKVKSKGWYVVLPHSGAYVLGNHAIYANATGKMIVTDLKKFLVENKELILSLTK
jgi:hypothetical protein